MLQVKWSLGGYEFPLLQDFLRFWWMEPPITLTGMYARIDSKLVLIHFDYYDELKNQVQQVYDSIDSSQA